MRETCPEDVFDGSAKWCVVEGDSSIVVPKLRGRGHVHAVVTDPPSGISFMGAAWDHHKGGRAQWVAWLAEILAASREACVDGARLISWAMPRTSHWTGCAVEDADWTIETKGIHLFGTGWPKGKSQLKPAAEDWWFARTGASLPLNIDACRVSTDEERCAVFSGAKGAAQSEFGAGTVLGNSGKYLSEPHSAGRYPPNVLLTHALECERVGVRKVKGDARQGGGTRPGGFGDVGANRGNGVPCAAGHADPDGTETIDDWRCVDGCPVRVLGEQSGESASSNHSRRNSARPITAPKGADTAHVTAGISDAGTAARFFPQFQHAPEEVPFLYCAKPSNAEKRAGLTDDDPRHPTVKPVDLMRWLIRLVTKPGDVVLDTFCGSGTTGVAALLEGRRFIGIERAPDVGEQAFAPIARARLEHSAPSPAHVRIALARPITARPSRTREDTLPLFAVRSR